VGDVDWTRMGLVVGTGILLVIATVFAVGGVYVMAIDVAAMGYVMRQTWLYYSLHKKCESVMRSKNTHFL